LGNRDDGGWRVHPMSVNQENTKYSNYGLTALILAPPGICVRLSIRLFVFGGN
jgi:hypothetical protein